MIIRCLCLLFLFSLPIRSEEPKSTDLTGYWEGSIQAQLLSLRFTFEFKKNNEGKWIGTLESHDESLKNIPVEQIEVDGSKIRFSIPKSKAKFAGTITTDRKQISGIWEQSKKLPLKLKRVEKPLVLVRPQRPIPPFPYQEIERKIENPQAKVTLAGTLTIPQGAGPFAAAILISGSGPQDRDETIVGHKPFLLIADRLTRAGIAVYRYDDRGVGQSTGQHGKATTADFTSDVEAIFTELKKDPRIDARQIGLIGHSEGGIIAAKVAAKNPDLAFIILMAGTGIPGQELLTLQNRRIQEKMGVPALIANKNLQFVATLMEAVRKDATEEELIAAGKKWFENLSLAEKLLGAAAQEQQIQTAVKQLSSPWIRYFIKHDPREDLRTVRCPVLALNGELDVQVPANPNLKEIAKALRIAGNENVRFRTFPNLNHLFQHCKTGLPNEYGQIEETLSEEVLTTMSKWLQETLSKKP